MTAVWEHHPASVRDVLESLGEDTSWAYSTAKTVLVRLADKGALRMTKKGNTSLFEPLVSREQAQRSALKTLLDRAFDGTLGSLVHHLVGDEKLSPKDRRELKKLLDETSPRSRKK